jgi:hypothetical protein
MAGFVLAQSDAIPIHKRYYRSIGASLRRAGIAASSSYLNI